MDREVIYIRTALVPSNVVPISGKQLVKIPKLFLTHQSRLLGKKKAESGTIGHDRYTGKNRSNLKLSVYWSLYIFLEVKFCNMTPKRSNYKNDPHGVK
jgi:hypothetical protein